MEDYLSNVLFVCSGNTCRSPMAEYLFRAMAAQKQIVARVASRGIFASENSDASDLAKQVTLELYPNSKISEHKSSKFRPADLLKYKTILTMGNSHRNKVLKNWPIRLFFSDKVFTLREYVGLADPLDPATYDIADPFNAGEFLNEEVIAEGLTSILSKETYAIRDEEDNKVWIIDPVMKLDAYRKCRNEIRKCLQRIVDGKIASLEEIKTNRKILKEKLKEKLE